MRNNPTKSVRAALAGTVASTPPLSSRFLNSVQTHRHGSTMRVRPAIGKRTLIIKLSVGKFSMNFSINSTRRNSPEMQ